MRNTELLIPASSLEVLKTAVLYGADAVYIGGEMYGLRAKARNFSREDMEAGVKFAHENGVKVYVTANIVAHNEDLEGIREYFRELKEIGPDALIISDPGVFMIAREECPDIERHISTQANSTNYATYSDPENEYLIQKAFEKLMQDKTVIMIAHRLSTIRNANKIIVMENGRLIESGKHNDLIQKNGRYAEMWKHYTEAIDWKVQTKVVQ